MGKINRFYEDSWWFDCVAPQGWGVIKIEDSDGKLLARLPYVIKKDRFGFKTITKPMFIQTQGPWLERKETNYKNLVFQETVCSELIRKLPKCDRVDFYFDPSMQNWLPFYWHGFSQTTRYTYVLDDLNDLDQLYKGFSSRTKRAIKKAEKNGVQIEQSDDIEILLKVLKETFDRQNIKQPNHDDILRKLFKAGVERDCMTLLVARTKEGDVCAANLFVKDRDITYYLAGGAIQKYRNLQAQSLIMWHGIKQASEHCSKFDFEGSMIQGVEGFFRGFGARQVQYFRVSKDISKKYRIFIALKNLAKAILR